MQAFNNTGVIAALITSVLLVFSQILGRYLFAELEFNVWSFVSIQSMAAGAVLICISGWKGLAFDTFKKPITWTIGLVSFLDSLFFGFALVYLAATEANILVGYAKFTTLIAAVLIFKRSIGWSRVPGLIILLWGLLPITFMQDGGFLNPGVVFCLLTVLCLTAELFLFEKHPAVKKAKNIKERCGYTGVLLIANGFIFLLFITLLAMIKTSIPSPESTLLLSLYAKLPALEDVLNVPLILTAIVVGVFLRASLNFFRYYAIFKMQAENYLMLASIQPLLTYGFETLALQMGWMNTGTLDDQLLLYIVIATIGSLMCLRKPVVATT